MSRSKPISLEHRERYIRIGLNIGHQRRLAGLSQEQLADKINISRTYMSEIESEHKVINLSLEVIFAIADALKISSSTLLECVD